MKTLLIILTLFLTGTAWADALGLRVSAGVWQYDPTGVIRNSPTPSETFDLETDLGIKDENGFQGIVYFEHPVPILPNFRFGVTQLKLAGTGTINGNKSWNGTPFPDGTTVSSDVDLSHTELGLYYELWDTGFDFDLGVNVKFFDGTVTLQGGGNTATSDFNEAIPLLYGHVGVPLPLGFNIAADISGVSYNGDQLIDSLISVGWTSSYMIGVELGYRSFSLDYTDGDKYADVKIRGPYLSATLKF